MSLRSWGLNTFGQLGHSGEENTWFPVEIEFFNDKQVKYVTGGDYHSLVLLQSGEVYAWGKNDENQLGLEDSTLVVKEPIKIDKFSVDNPIESVLSYTNYSYAINYSKQKFFSWGFGENYILGNQENKNQPTPFEIPKEFYKGFEVKRIGLGSQHVIACLKNNIVKSNDSGKEAVAEPVVSATTAVVEPVEHELDTYEFDITPFIKGKGNKGRKRKNLDKDVAEKPVDSVLVENKEKVKEVVKEVDSKSKKANKKKK